MNVMALHIPKCLELVDLDQQMTSPAAKVPYYPLVVDKGKGATVTDVDGNQYIDLLASAGAINTGHCHPKVVEAIKKQTEQLILYTPVYMYHRPLIDLSQKLIEITPGNYRKRVFYGLCGSDANDGAIKMARTATKKKEDPFIPQGLSWKHLRGYFSKCRQPAHAPGTRPATSGNTPYPLPRHL
jgi:4-aminobutyrate aminotransferase